MGEDSLEFSFSGLKTAVYYLVKKQEHITEQFSSDISASFQEAIAETLISKCTKALNMYDLKQLVIGGGVAANQYIKKRIADELPEVDIFFPEPKRCTDNGAMIAIAGYYRFNSKESEKEIKIRPKWNFSEL